VDEHADRRHDDEEHAGQLVDREPERHLEAAGRDPGVEREVEAVLAVATDQRGEDDDQRDQPRGDDRRHGHDPGSRRQPSADRGRDREAGQRQEEQQRHERLVPGHGRGPLGALGRGDDRERAHLPAHHWRIWSYSSTSGVRRLR
jgi:hypothetical protein